MTPIPVAPVGGASPAPRTSQPPLPEAGAPLPPTAPAPPSQEYRSSAPSLHSMGSASAWTNHSPSSPPDHGGRYSAPYSQSSYGAQRDYEPQGSYPENPSPAHRPSYAPYPHPSPAASYPPASAPAPYTTPQALPRESIPTPAPNRVSTVEQIGGFGHWFLSVADRTDRFLYGRRTAFVATLAALTILAGFVDDTRLPVLTAASTLLFTFLLFILVAARIGSLRDEEGNWSFALLGQRMSTWWDGALEFATAGGSLIAQDLAKATAFLGLLVLGLRNTLMLVILIADELFGAPLPSFDAAYSSMSWLGTALCVLGALVLIVARLQIRSTAESQGLVLDDKGKAQLRSSVLGLPPLIDCSNVPQLRALIGQTSHPLLKELLETLAAWKPRNMNNEQAYHASLYRTLRRRMPGAKPEKERPIAEDTPELRGRADLVIGDAVLIELKARLTKSAAHRAIGQIRMYARAWTQGPIVLVVCGGDKSRAHQLLSQELAELHKKAPVFMVLTGV